MKNILVLTEFSAAESALPVVARLGADLYLMHIYPVTRYLPPAGIAYWPQQECPSKKGAIKNGKMPLLIFPENLQSYE